MIAPAAVKNMQLIDLAEAIVVREDEIGQLKLELSDRTGMEYADFLNGMRRLLAPVSA